ncbi:Methylmalonyl-CoA mutase small subunit [Dirofilaria immitis]
MIRSGSIREIKIGIERFTCVISSLFVISSMATLGRRIEPKPSTTNISEAIPLLLVPVTRQPAVAIPTQFIPRTIFIDAQSLQANMDSNREAPDCGMESAQYY